MTPIVVRHISRPESAPRLGRYGVSTIHEAMGQRGLMRFNMRPIDSTAHIAGPAVTVSCPPGDNLMMHAAVEVCRPGDVLVVATWAESSAALLGELLATQLQARGVLGLVIDAGVRDVAGLNEMRFPVWAASICAQGPAKAAAGSVNVAIVCAGTIVHPGDVIVADSDGIIVVPREMCDEVCRAAEQRAEKERVMRERFRSGELSLDIYGIRDKLKALGVQYVD